MSRVGREITIIPAGVSVKYENNLVTVTGPKGTLSQEIKPQIIVKIEGNEISLTRADDSRQVKAYHGLYSRLISNMVKGVSTGFTRKLIFHGVGYKASMQGTTLVLNVGFSHPVKVEALPGITISCLPQNEILVAGADKEAVGAMASKIRAIKKVEPYHMYGIRYANERVIRKESKSGAKKK